MPSSLKGRVSYLKMEEVLLERECDRAREGVDRYTQILKESEALLDGVRMAIVNYQNILDTADPIS